MFFTNQNAEIVACIHVLSFRKSRHKPNLESTSKYGFSPDLGGKVAAFSACACRLFWPPGLSFRQPGFSPYVGREERRVQGLDLRFDCPFLVQKAV